MDLILEFIDKIRHLDKTLDQITRDYGVWTYAILAAIIFCETGLVILPFLPGDSLLFACGAISMRDESGLNPWLLGPLLIVCAIAGDTVNYHIGKAIGPRVMKSETSRWLNKKHLDKTHRFFEKYGGKTIILARFVPIVRTFAPFVAGAGAMNYGKFILYNVVGAVAWVVSMMGAGMIFGQMEFVKKNFELVVLMIIFLSILPMIIEWWKARGEAKAELQAAEAVAADSVASAATKHKADATET
jgi:membrane-associated protein